MKMGVSCKNCGGTEIDHDQARGDAVCIGCGSVVESLCIVSEIEFQENSAGNASVIGQFVSAEGQHHSMGSNLKYGTGRDHRQVILDNGKQLINQMGSQLKMSHHCLDSAFMFYKMAVSKRFTSGRKTIHVIGACLYLVSRTEKTPHMLLDVCDVVQCDVVTLGRVFLQLARELCIDCPIVDPSLYIHRFAHQLDFGEKENEISMTALRIMARMKKDWIHFGRRPSALCGAALIIAGKLFSYNVTMTDIVKLVRMSKTTVFKRLMDFSKTATGKLTTDEFKTVDLEEEADPPSYTAGRNRVKFAQELGDNYRFVSSDVLSQVVKTQEKLEVLLEKRKTIHKDLEITKTEAESFDYRKELPSDYSLYTYELDENGGLKNPLFVIHNESDISSEKLEESGKSHASSTLLLDSKTKSEPVDVFKEEKIFKDLKGEEENDEIELDDIDDKEIDKLLLTEDEIKIKTEIWMEENKEYLLKMKEKEEEQKRKEEEESKSGIKRKKKTYKRKQKDRPICDTADEAIKTMLAERKLSSKINYDVLRGLRSEDKNQDFKVVKNERNTDSEADVVDTNIKVEDKPQLLESIMYESGPTKRTNKRNAKTTFISLGASDTKRVKVEQEQRNLTQSLETIPVIEEHKPKVEEMQPIVESGPVSTNVDDDDYVEEEEEGEVITASALFAKEVDDYDTYGYDDGDTFY